jgi:hypothetical protein
MLLPLLGAALLYALSGPQSTEVRSGGGRARRHAFNCTGTHCQYPGHDWYCLPRYVGHVNGDGKVYCHRHFRHLLGLRRR